MSILTNITGDETRDYGYDLWCGNCGAIIAVYWANIVPTEESKLSLSNLKSMLIVYYYYYYYWVLTTCRVTHLCFSAKLFIIKKEADLLHPSFFCRHSSCRLLSVPKVERRSFVRCRRDSTEYAETATRIPIVTETGWAVRRKEGGIWKGTDIYNIAISC